MVAKGEILELTVDSAAFEGFCVARVDDFVIFLRGAVPGDHVRARITRRRRRHAEAEVIDVLRPSDVRVEPRCPYFGTCGGCSWQNVDYNSQLEFKRRQVTELFCRIGGLSDVDVRPVLGSGRTYYYRNKMEFTFSPGRWLTRAEIASGQSFDKRLALGLHVPERFDKVLDLDVCYLQSPVSAQILNRIRRLAQERDWSAYDAREHVGFLRNLIIRTSEATGELMVVLVTAQNMRERMEEVKAALLSDFSEITTLINIVNATRSPAPVGDLLVYHGEGTITDQIGNVSFTIGPTTFFQPNTQQAQTLYSVVREFASLNGEERIVDLYSGTGGIALSLAGSAGAILGIENYPPSVELAVSNARRNNITNCSFLVGDAARVLESLPPEFGKPDVILLDPPRSGVHPDLYGALARLTAPRVVYVSCNPATQARDLKELGGAYRVRVVQPVDMFPQTYHIESVALLERV